MKSIGKKLALWLIAFMVSSELSAQLCQGSLGDPIVNITFGQGSNPGAPLQAATTSYTYVQETCPSDGFYTVRNSSLGCFGNTWQNLTADHTGNGSGYFMLVNASLQPSAFYLDTVRGLCANSTYEFAAWIMNMLLPSACNGSGIQPNITFRIERTDGTLLQSYNSNGIPSTNTPTWKQYGFFFTTPVGASDVVLRMINNSVGGCGNDLALDDITFRPCGPSLVPVAGLPNNSDAICQGTAKSYTFSYTVSGGFNNPAYQWQERVGTAWVDIAGATTTTLPRNFPATTAPGTYSFRLSVAEAGNMSSPQCRIASTPIVITVNPLPVTSASNDGPVCEKTPATLTATGGATYTWNGPNSYANIGSPANIPPVGLASAGKYYVRVITAAGCEKRDSTILVVNPAPVVTVAPTETTICSGQSTTLTANGGITYTWNPQIGLSDPAAASTIASPTDSTTYTVTAANALGCKDSTTSKVNVLRRPTADAGPDRYIVGGQPIVIEANGTGDGISFNWVNAAFINDPTLLRPTVSPPSNTTYILNVSSSNGCGSASDTMDVKVFEDIYIPNVFTPNDDGVNDTWNVVTLNAFPDHELNVYNRWGQLVFSSSRVNKPWNGKFKGLELPTGVYVYVVNLKSPPRPILRGTVTIVR